MAQGTKTIRYASMFIGTIACVWASASVLSGLAAVNWQVSELLRQYLVAVGLMQEFHTLSDFYTHIKGVEYILAVAFLGTFPAFYSYMSKSPATEAATN